MAIGAGLRARGHRVTMITSEPFRGVAERNGLEFVGTVTADAFSDQESIVEATRLVARGSARMTTAMSAENGGSGS